MFLALASSGAWTAMASSEEPVCAIGLFARSAVSEIRKAANRSWTVSDTRATNGEARRLQPFARRSGCNVVVA